MRKKYKIIGTFIAITICISAILFLSGKIQYGDRLSVATSNDYYTNIVRYEIDDNNIYEQTFEFDGEKLYSISLRYFVLEEIQDASWKIQLISEKGNIIQEVYLKNGIPYSRYRLVNPIPEDEEAFEKVWKKYRENGNVY